LYGHAIYYVSLRLILEFQYVSYKQVITTFFKFSCGLYVSGVVQVIALFWQRKLLNVLYNKGSTSGSRVEFVNSAGESVKVHRPHGREPMDVGALKDVRAQLAELEVL
jgi:hypothetical protein